MKGKYYVIFLGIIVLGLIVGIWRLRSGTSSSPEATVKAFYGVLNKGDLTKVQEYISPDTSLDMVLPNWDKLRVQGEDKPLKLFAGKIQKVEIEGKQVGNATAQIVTRVTLKPGVIEEARRIMEETKLAPRLPLKFWECWLLDNLQGKKQVWLKKWDGKWKISGLGPVY